MRKNRMMALLLAGSMVFGSSSVLLYAEEADEQFFTIEEDEESEIQGDIMAEQDEEDLYAEDLIEDADEVLSAAETSTETSGTCGANLNWSLDSDGKLTIEGTGEMTNYSMEDGEESPFMQRADIKSIVITDGVTSIGSYAFYNCGSVTNITVADSVTSIGDAAVSGCSSLKSITIPDNLTNMGFNMFINCSSLESIKIPKCMSSIPNYYFFKCSSLKSVTIPNSVTRIGMWSFQFCSSLESITIPGSVTSIGEGAFEGCSSLTSITIPDSVTTIEEGVFSGCNNCTIYGITGSYAEQYADANHIPFMEISDQTDYDLGNCVVTFDSQYHVLDDIQSTPYPDYFYNVPAGTVLAPIVKNGDVTLSSDCYSASYCECMFYTERNEWDKIDDTAWIDHFPTDPGVYLCIVEGVTPYYGSYEWIDLIRIMPCVTFDSRGGSAVESQYVVPGRKAAVPEKPQKGQGAWAIGGGDFAGWYTDETLNNEFNFNTPINDNITLYAKWYYGFSVCSYDISNQEYGAGGRFSVGMHGESYGGSNFTMLEGDVTLNAAPDKGFIFKGWYKGEYVGITDTGHTQASRPLDVEDPDNLLSTDRVFTFCLNERSVICPVFEVCTNHDFGPEQIQKATPTEDGRIYHVCQICEADETVAPLLKVDKIKLSGTIFTYTGKAIKPTVTVANASETLSADNYTVAYAKNVNAGKGTVTVTLDGQYYSGKKTLTFTIKKAANPLTVQGKSVKVKASKLKKKKQTVKLAQAMTVSKNQGRAAYRLNGVNKKKFKKYFTINASNGNITVKKGLKKGTYKLNISVTASGNANYLAATKTVTVTIKVK